MKEIALKSLKNTKVVTVILAIVCVVLLGVDVYQNNQFNRAIQQQTDSYKELMLAQQPDMQDPRVFLSPFLSLFLSLSPSLWLSFSFTFLLSTPDH